MKLSQILQELLLLQIDKDRLERHNMEIIEEYEIGPYAMLLLKSRDNNSYKISITSDEQEFTSSASQGDKPSKQSMSTILSSLALLINKVKQWVLQYNTIEIGSHNNKRTEKYHRILSRAGLNVGDIVNTFNGSYFNISKSTK